MVEDDFHQESGPATEENYLGGSGFQMPDNFDLPDEIIHGQRPKCTSTPIRYAKVCYNFWVHTVITDQLYTDGQ